MYTVVSTVVSTVAGKEVTQDINEQVNGKTKAYLVHGADPDPGTSTIVEAVGTESVQRKRDREVTNSLLTQY